LTWSTMRSTLSTLAAFVALASANEPLYSYESSPLVELDDSNFEKLVLRDEKHLWVVEYYADWCGHCKQFAKGYEKAATNLDGIVKFGALNSDTHKKTSQSQGVQGFPSVKLYVPGTGQKNPYTGKFFKPPIDYTGPRTARGVVEFATAKLPSLVVPVTDVAKFRSNGTLPKALLVTKKTETASMFKSLSVAFSGRMLIGEARDTATKVVEELGVTEFPSVVVLPAGGGEKVAFDGKITPASLAAFFETHAAAEGAADEAAADDSFVLEVNTSNVASLVEGERAAWVLVFAGSESADLPSEGGIAALGEALNGQVNVGKASAELAGKFGVTLGAAPAIAVFPYRKAGKARKASTFAGTADGVAAAKKAALDTLPDDGVTTLNQATADRWMQESMMTTDAKAFCILFSDKPVVPPLMRALAIEFEGQLGFGMAQAADKAMAGRFNVQKAPTLLVMFPDESKKGEDGNVPLAGMQFQPQVHGKFNFGNLANFVSGVVQMRMQEMGTQPGGAGADGAKEGQQQERAPRATKDVGPAPELTADNFEAECVAKGGLCGIALLDGAPENSGKAPAVEMLSKLRAKKAGGPISFSWIDATCHSNFAAAFELGETDLPTMIFLSPQKLKWARSVGAFDVETLGNFGNRVAAGRVSTNSVSELPTLEEVDCSTVKRGADAVVEDDGADDIMAEILEEERRAREEREAALAAEGVKEAAAPVAGKKKSDMTKLEKLEADVEECESMDLLCSARREKQLKTVEKQRDLEAKLAKIAKKKKKAKAKAKKAA